MTINEARIKESNNTNVIGTRKNIDGVCYEATSIAAVPLNVKGNDYDVIVYLSPIAAGTDEIGHILVDIFMDCKDC